MEEDIDSAVERLLLDDKLTKLCDTLRTGEDILDMISLTENQHSDVLAWLFDPREGHGQGDQIVRDLLLGAAKIYSEHYDLDGRGTTARFLASWPPSRIRTASFGSVFVARELGMRADERVDLFVIDPVNEFVMLIENKAGLTHNSDQLDRYRESWMRTINGVAHLRGFSSVFIALDREFAGDDRSELPSSGHWLHMGYDWLKPSAERALLHVERGNAAARLVVTYCNRQTDWESPVTKQAIALAVELHEGHQVAIKEMLKGSTERLEKNWVESRTDHRMMFRLQNKAVISLLRETQGMASVKETLLGKIPGLTRDRIGHSKGWLEVCPLGWEKHDSQYGWPVFFRVVCSEGARVKYDLSLILDVNYADSDESAYELREKLKDFDSAFAKHLNSDRRRVVLKKDMASAELAGYLEICLAKLKNLA
ncbi:PD-(D/E)XK nuclease family protein [Pseudomonas viridiflava]|uniref:PDDEXK-like family protein n=1 Tax=Pseudomonas viridiflava TaxID=33069 RepID=UPI000F0110E1|nr:PD-(D/E)XK nuclease family protein [Pseudomonas viridiflava]MBI6576513.1 PD-(D/E)XK nuclease family protein [Pseudomonas viridiflava]MBI6610484.1 PD-(D/E)XK nuclease family protein [Pseudomonas viridiflava]MBI6637968.1 PD-(D/E)XK nuclease family protein [Pseudomonas viridiflava]MBI6866264.1 PD-(D/E)XK nuclease family protein [Pseudomonas viridiflava]MEE4103874.1 PD-(D/E)XK nuclease family protein [Pseudomonas viridiflava]